MDFIVDITNSFWFQTIFKLVLGFLLAGFIGLERSAWNKPAGFRTHALLGISAVLVMLCGEHVAQSYGSDPTRIPAQLLSGIGFIGAGTILRDGFNVKGLTTAAGLLAVTCIGLSIGAGYYLGGFVATLIVYIILSYSHKFSEKLEHFDELEFHIKLAKEESIRQIEKVLTKYEVEIKQIKKLESDSEEEIHSVILVLEYNKQIFNKNQLIRAISLVENVSDVVVQ